MGMSATLKSLMQADLVAMKADWSETLAFKNSTLTGTFSPVAEADSLDAEGLLETAQATFVADADDYAAMVDRPRTRDTVRVADELYYIVDIGKDPAAVTISLRRN
jgi:hypothetical protein